MYTKPFFRQVWSLFRMIDSNWNFYHTDSFRIMRKRTTTFTAPMIFVQAEVIDKKNKNNDGKNNPTTRRTTKTWKWFLATDSSTLSWSRFWFLLPRKSMKSLCVSTFHSLTLVHSSKFYKEFPNFNITWNRLTSWDSHDFMYNFRICFVQLKESTECGFASNSQVLRNISSNLNIFARLYVKCGSTY